MPITHTMEPGDCIAAVAARYGFGDPALIHGHPDNAALCEERPNENVMRPGDRVVVPDRDLGEIEVASGRAHRFTVRRPKVEIVVALISDRDEPLSGARYLLVIGKEEIEGKTDGDGLLRAPVDAEARSADLHVWTVEGAEIPSDAFRLEIGSLQPITETAGAQARLRNLGHYFGATDGELGPRTRRAIKAFQAKQGLPITGELDDDTRGALEKGHGC